MVISGCAQTDPATGHDPSYHNTAAESAGAGQSHGTLAAEMQGRRLLTQRYARIVDESRKAKLGSCGGSIREPLSERG